MTTPEPKPGQRWRVTLEGEVVKDFPEGWVMLRCYPDARFTITLSPGVGTWERLPEPEPDYPIGSAWKSTRDGLAWIRTEDGWLWWKGFAPFDAPLRPLVRLVPEVQA